MREFLKKQFTPSFSAIGAALLGFLILNAFWALASQWIFVFRPFLNYDYGLGLMLAPFSTILCVIAFVVIYAMEMFIANSMIFHFDSVFDFFKSSEFIGNLTLQDFFNIKDTALFLAFMICVFLTARILKNKTNVISVFIVILLAVGADQLNGSSYLIKNDDQLVAGNISGSSALQIYASFKGADHKVKPASVLSADELPLSAADISAWIKQNPDKSVLFILVESMGLNSDPALNEWLLAQLKSNYLEGSYNIEAGAATFEGSTTSAEMRHLCGLKANYSSALNEDLTQNCIPKIFAEREGYDVVGAHGFTANMFRRNVWWPQLGFEELLFVQDFQDTGAPNCGSGLYGTCDDFIIDYLGQRIEQQKGFYYHLTLNTHLPIVKTPVPAELQTLCDAAQMTTEACVINAKIGEYLQAVSKTLAGMSHHPLVFIVGDHAPPFSTPDSRNSFSRTQTPYFILRPWE